MIRFLFLCFTVLFWLPLAGQQDRYAIHFDKPFYTSGEVIWFAVYPPYSDPESSSGILRIALHDPGGDEVHHFHLRQSETELAHGYIRVPYDWSSGYYRLSLQCPSELKNTSHTLMSALIPVYNDLEAPGSLLEEPKAGNETDTSGSAGETGKLQVDVALDRERYRPGMIVEATLTVKDDNGKPVPANLSVSVSDQVLAGSTSSVGASFQTATPGKAICAASDPNMTFQGQVLDSTGAPRRTYSLSAYLPVLDTFLYTKTDKEGHFSLPLPDFYGNADIQFADYIDNHIRIKPVISTAVQPASAIPYTEPVIEYLRLSQERKKIYQLYGSLEIFVAPEIPSRKTTSVDPDRVIRLNDYEPFPDIPTLFRELLTPLKFRKENGRPVARMYNTDLRQYYRSDPIFLIDGQLTMDAAYIATLDIDKIEEIALYYEAAKLSTQFGRLGLGGVVNLKTKDAAVVLPASVAPNRFDITGLQPPAVFPTAGKTEHPVFRPLVFWEGNLQTNAEGKVRIKFPHTDDLSKFRIKVTARDKEGRLGFGAGEYRVEE